MDLSYGDVCMYNAESTGCGAYSAPNRDQDNNTYYTAINCLGSPSPLAAGQRQGIMETQS